MHRAVSWGARAPQGDSDPPCSCTRDRGCPQLGFLHPTPPEPDCHTSCPCPGAPPPACPPGWTLPPLACRPRMLRRCPGPGSALAGAGHGLPRCGRAGHCSGPQAWPRRPGGLHTPTPAQGKEGKAGGQSQPLHLGSAGDLAQDAAGPRLRAEDWVLSAGPECWILSPGCWSLSAEGKS